MTALNNFEDVLQYIHGNHISQKEDEVTKNNEILGEVVDEIILEMKKDVFFKDYFSNKKFYGGSYYDGLKVGKPDKFDLYLIIKVPASAKPKLIESDRPPYLYMQIAEPAKLSQAFRNKFLVDECFLSTKQVRAWMKSVFSKALNAFGTEWAGYNFGGINFYLQGTRSEDGPAMILRLEGPTISINIDFVPCFEFTNDQWPSYGFTPNPSSCRGTFLIVPKSPLPMDGYPRYWRPIFQEQERELIHGKNNLKPTLKLLKRLRDVQQHKIITDYCIKTIFLWVDKKNGDNFWRYSMKDVFFKMLDRYILCIDSGNIPYYWNTDYNLLEIPNANRENIVNRLRNIQKDLLKNYETDPFVVLKYLNYPPPTTVRTYKDTGYTSYYEPVVTKGFLSESTSHSTSNRYGYQPRSNSNSYSGISNINSARTAPTRSVPVETSTSNSDEGLSGLAKFGIGLGIVAAVGGLAYALSNANTNDDDSDDD